MKSVKDLAAELGVTPQTVRNTIAKLGILPKSDKTKRGFYLDDNDEARIKTAILPNQENDGKTKRTQKQEKGGSLLLLLQKELDAKNEQIKTLQEENKKLTDSLAVTTDTLAKTMESLKAEQALHGVTVQQLLEMKNQDGAAVPDAADGKTNNKKWWQFWK